MVYVQQVEEEKLRYREEYQNKKVKIVNESGQQKGGSSRPQFQKLKGHAPGVVEITLASVAKALRVVSSAVRSGIS